MLGPRVGSKTGVLLNAALGSVADDESIGYTGFTDATSGKRIPQTAADYTSLRTSFGLSIGNPNQLNPCQDASGNLLDVVGTFNMAPTGVSQLYRQAVPGWSLLGAGYADGVAEAFTATTGDVATTNQFVLALMAVQNTPAANRTTLFYGTARLDVDISGSKVYSGRTAALAFTNGVQPIGVVVRPVGMLITAGVAVAFYTDQEIITPAFGALVGTDLFVGGAALAAPTLRVLHLARWSGANAIQTTANVRSLYQAMGFSPPW